MANVTSFSQAHAAITGGKGPQAPSISSSSGNNSFASARNIVVQNNQQNNAQVKAKPTLNVSQAFASGGLTKTSTPQQPTQPQNPLFSLVGNMYKGVVGEVGSKLNPHPTVSTPTPVANKTVNLPLGIKLNLGDAMQPDQSAKRKVTPSGLQQQKTAVDTGKKILDPIKRNFQQTDQGVQRILSDPFNYKVVPQILMNPKRAVSDIINDLNIPKQLGKTMQENQAYVKQNKDVLLGKKGTKDQTIATWLHAVSNQANFVFSPLSSIFTAADKLPIVGGLAKLITLPFTAAGEGGSAAAGKIIDELPISDQAKTNLKPAVKEIGSLVGQLVLGHITTIGENKKAQLVSKYGQKDTQVIIDQASKIAEQKTIQPGTYSSAEMRNEVFKRNMQESSTGREIIKATIEADKTGQSIEVKSPNIQTLDQNISDYRSYGGYTDGKSTPNAALRDIENISSQLDVIKHTQEKVNRAIDNGDLKLNDDGTVTLYRGGKPSDHNNLVSASYNKEIAKTFADNEGTPVKEIKVKPEDIKAFIGKVEGEVLVDKKVVNAQPSSFKSVGEILDKKNTRTTTEDKPNTERVKTSTPASKASEPVGTGAPKESRAYKRLVEHLAATDPETYEKIKDDPKLLYNKVNQKYDFENAANIVAKDPQKAYNIAKQYEAAPQGQRWESVNIVLADRALQDKNYGLWKDLEQSRSLAQTRAGQGIVAERGRFNDNSPHAFVQRLLDARMRKLGGETELTKAIDMTKKFVGKATSSAKERAVAKIDAAVERARQFTKKERAKIDFAQKLLDDLTCK